MHTLATGSQTSPAVQLAGKHSAAAAVGVSAAIPAHQSPSNANQRRAFSMMASTWRSAQQRAQTHAGAEGMVVSADHDIGPARQPRRGCAGSTHALR
jgi:hypothetical protein